MKKIIYIVLKVVLSLIFIMSILGSLGVFPAPTADMYNTGVAFTFITILMTSHYVNIMMSIVFAIALFCMWTGRMALAALIILPITLNIVGFHAFLDSGLFTVGAIMGNVLFLINVYFLWLERNRYAVLLNKSY